MRSAHPLRAFGRDIGLALVLACAALLLAAATLALGADPSAPPSEILSSGDLRSEGEGPGLVGSPLLILAGVVLLGLVTALTTVLIVRLTRRD